MKKKIKIKWNEESQNEKKTIRGRGKKSKDIKEKEKTEQGKKWKKQKKPKKEKIKEKREEKICNENREKKGETLLKLQGTKSHVLFPVCRMLFFLHYKSNNLFVLMFCCFLDVDDDKWTFYMT